LYGNFTGYTNGYVTDYAGGIIRLNSDLTIDYTFSGGGTGFNSVLFDGESIIEQGDGKIIATGSFTSYNGTLSNRIIRLNSDGSIDPSFIYGTGFNNFTQGGGIDSNGSIVITGSFVSYNGTPSVRIIRLLSNGQVDPSFIYGSGFNNTTIDILINPDNSMYVVGYFSAYKGVSVVSNGIVKLLSNGSVDSTFSGGTGFSPFLPNNPNNIVRISGETSFYVAGYSTSYNGTLINRIVKLNEFGGIDTSFTGGTGFNNVVSTTDIIWVDKIFLIGAFTDYNGNSCLANCIILNSDGSVLQSFNDSNYTNFFVNNYTVFAKSTITGCIVPVYNYITPTPTPTPTETPTNTPTNTPTVTPTISSQTITYSESTDIIANPERGLQKYSKNTSGGSYSLINQTTLINNRIGTDKVTVLYRYVMLENYLNTDVIDNTYLNNLQTDFTRIRNAGIKVILRLSYNNDTLINTQPSKSRIIAHIQDVASVFNTNKDVILSIQAGSIGKYGEWYYTDGSVEFGDEGTISPTQWLNRKDVVDAMLTNFEDVPIQVRYAEAKIQMYGSTLITIGTAYQNTALARVGFYNDALLNDYGDQGTYSVNTQCGNPTGTTEYSFIANAGQYLPMTGEPNGINPCDGGYRTSGFNAVYEFNLLNFSVINRDYEPNVWAGWINQGYYNEILRNLGYRLQLVSSTLSGSNLSLIINNVGYSKVLFEKKTYIIYRDNLNNEFKRLLPIDLRTLNKGNNTVNITLPNDVPSNSYLLLLQITDKTVSLENTVAYCIQFANTGLWEISTGYNNLQQTVVVP
jgi:uncharacterized delta-60 repeat protein